MKINEKKMRLAMARNLMDSKDLAEKVVCTVRSIQQTLAGKSIPTKKLGQIAKALEVDPAELIED